jgi:hypothetical protein
MENISITKRLKKKTRPVLDVFIRGGEGGIRTRDWFNPALT